MNAEELRKRLETLETKESEREKKEIISQWLYTKCIWVWTMVLGWLFYAGVFIVEHYEKVAVVIIAAFKALKDVSK